MIQNWIGGEKEMKAPVLLAIVVGIHAVAIGGFSLLTGCATPPNVNGTRAAASTAPHAEGVSAPSISGSAITVPQPPRSSDPTRSRSVVREAAKVPPPVTVGGADSLVELPGTIAPAPGAQLGAPRPNLGSPRPSRSSMPTPVDTKDLAGTKYTIKKGDMLSKIAATYGIGWRELAEYNGISNPGSIREGQQLVIPSNAKKKPATAPSAGTTSGSTASAGASSLAGIRNAGGSGTYKVQKGDSLSRIAVRTGTPVAELKKLNNLSSDMIKVGQELKVSGSAASTAATPAGNSRSSTPAAPPAGSSIDDIIRSLDAGNSRTTVPVNPGRAANPASSSLVPPVAPSPVVEAVPDIPVAAEPVFPGRKPYEYTVLATDTVRTIATSFIVSEAAIRKMNNLGPNDEVQAGDKIKIPNSEP